MWLHFAALLLSVEVKRWGSFCSIPVRLTTPVAGCSDSFMGSPPANYVSSKQHRQAGTEQADGNIPCYAVVVMVLLWTVFAGQSSCMLCKYNVEPSLPLRETVESYWDAGSALNERLVFRNIHYDHFHQVFAQVLCSVVIITALLNCTQEGTIAQWACCVECGWDKENACDVLWHFFLIFLTLAEVMACWLMFAI